MGREEAREFIFEDVILNKIIDAFKDELMDFDFSDEQVDLFEKELEKYGKDDHKKALSMPYEIRQNNFPRYFEEIEMKRLSVENLVTRIVKIAKDRGYTIGFHTSEKDLVPEDGKWDITGYEFDDRDNRAMAYYSLDYRNLYRAKRKKFVYIVHAQTGEGTDHKLDGKNNWGRASTLSVVLKINLEKLDTTVTEILEKYKKKTAK